MKDIINSIKESIVNKDNIDPKNSNNLYLENWLKENTNDLMTPFTTP